MTFTVEPELGVTVMDLGFMGQYREDDEELPKVDVLFAPGFVLRNAFDPCTRSSAPATSVCGNATIRVQLRPCERQR